MFSCLFVVFGYFDDMSSSPEIPAPPRGASSKPLPPSREIPAPSRESWPPPIWGWDTSGGVILRLEDYPPPCVEKARPYDDTYINLHVRRVNGDLIVKELVNYFCCVGDFLDRLEDTGLVRIEPSDEIDDLPETCPVEGSGETHYLQTDAYVDELVWGSLIQDWSHTFGFYVENYGMSVSEPVDVILVRHSRMTLYAASRAN